MPRLNVVNKCRKSPGSCGKCGDKIDKGQPYKWWKFRYGGKRVRCAKPECAPKSSDLTQSEFYGTLYGIQEELEAAIEEFRNGEGDKDAMCSALNGAA